MIKRRISIFFKKAAIILREAENRGGCFTGATLQQIHNLGSHSNKPK